MKTGGRRRYLSMRQRQSSIRYCTGTHTRVMSESLNVAGYAPYDHPLAYDEYDRKLVNELYDFVIDQIGCLPEMALARTPDSSSIFEESSSIREHDEEAAVPISYDVPVPPPVPNNRQAPALPPRPANHPLARTLVQPPGTQAAPIYGPRPSTTSDPCGREARSPPANLFINALNPMSKPETGQAASRPSVPGVLLESSGMARHRIRKPHAHMFNKVF